MEEDDECEDELDDEVDDEEEEEEEEKAPDPKKMSAITVADIKPVESTLTFQPQHRIGFR